MPRPLKLLLVAGARPNFMKVAPVLRAIAESPSVFEHVLVHTGQHYDEGMSDVFFSDLGIPTPDEHLEVGSGSHAQQTARIMSTFEPVLLKEKPDCVLVFGDVNSTIACAIVAKKLGHRVAHVEAGLRSGDMTMPEEVNRIVTDAISDYLFVTEESGVTNLLREGKNKDCIHHVGHVMIDNLMYELGRIQHMDPASLNSSKLKPSGHQFGVVTLHRPSNVDSESTLRQIFSALNEISESLPLVFPVHPRTNACMKRHNIGVADQITLVEPLGYHEFLNLWKDATLVLTDSGGLQEETTALGIPCLTIRENTERPITVTEGTNTLVGTDRTRIVNAALALLKRDTTVSARARPALWDGRASYRILDILAKELDLSRRTTPL
ncbi:MAG: UDP-N-acetylglucosamine 2-epimerase (non-hydrolyzing) [Gammaproteobacteria bacterium]